ncbi:MAG: hypothetical protein J0L74_13695, partial [Burkholderiales bacterium]|nr:hypothetical protein [Burkholderiales bacterium]
MSNEFSSLKEVFRGILVALAVPAAGCGGASTLATGAPDAGGADVVTRPDAGAQPDAVDVVVPVDTGRCAPIPMPGCPTTVLYPCGIPEITPGGENGVNIERNRCRVLCAPAYPMGWEGPSCTATRAGLDGNEARVQCDTCVIGRRVEGFAPRASDEGDLVGRFFAAASQLEAASVVAFRTLADELRALGAPDELVLAALGAAEEERRHARVTRAIARD